jgi:hypothetical protein
MATPRSSHSLLYPLLSDTHHFSCFSDTFFGGKTASSAGRGGATSLIIKYWLI